MKSCFTFLQIISWKSPFCLAPGAGVWVLAEGAAHGRVGACASGAGSHHGRGGRRQMCEVRVSGMNQSKQSI